MVRTVVYAEVGGPDVLQVVDLDVPPVGDGKALVSVEAAGINPFDAKVRSGFIPLDTPFPRKIGTDLAGTVIKVGDRATYWNGTPIKVGDAVMGTTWGALADQVIVDASDVTRRPESLDVTQAGSLNVPGLTAVSVLATVAVNESDTVLVGGATGAVGFLVTQLALKAGATVIGTAHPRNHGLLRNVGAIPVAYGAGLVDRVLDAGSVTTVYDCHGRDALDAGVVLGVPADRMVAIAAYDALEELGVNNVERDSRPMKNLAHIAEEVAEGRIIFPIAQTFALEDVAAAFKAMEHSHAPGKIVVIP